METFSEVTPPSSCDLLVTVALSSQCQVVRGLQRMDAYAWPHSNATARQFRILSHFPVGNTLCLVLNL